MRDKIKKEWSKLGKEAKARALKRILKEFKLSSEMYFMQRWIYSGKIPEYRTERFFEILKEEKK